MVVHLLIGLIAGAFLGATGTSWGAIAIPFLLSFNIPPLLAKGNVLFSEVVLSVEGSVHHGILGNIRKELSLSLILGIAGAIAGAGISEVVPTEAFKPIIGAYEILAGISMLVVKPKNLINVDKKRGIHWAIMIGFVAGFVKGFLGTGWGPIGVTLLIIFGAIPTEVVGSSILARVVVSGAAAILYTASGYLKLSILIPLTIGGTVGMFLGIRSLRYISEKTLTTLMGSIVFALGIWMIVK